MKVSVQESRAKMVVHASVKTNVNVLSPILVLNAREKGWESKKTQQQTHKQFLTPVIAWGVECTGSSPLAKQRQLKPTVT